MNIVVECDIVLSKKLEAVCENGEPISISISSVFGNKGKAVVRMVSKNGVSENDILGIGETSLIMKVGSVFDDVKSLGGSPRVSNLMGRVIPSEMENLVSKTSPDTKESKPFESKPPTVNQETLQLLATLLKSMGVSTEQIPERLSHLNAGGEIPPSTEKSDSAVASSKPTASRNSIMSYEELEEELGRTPGIENVPKIRTDQKLTPSEAERISSQLARLGKKAFVRNCLQSMFMVSDLYTSFDGSGPCLSLWPGAVCDLSRIPARNIRNSVDLKWCFESKKLEFVSEPAYISSFKKLTEESNVDTIAGSSDCKVYAGRSRFDPNDNQGSMAEKIAAGELFEDDEGEGKELKAYDSGSMSASADDPVNSNYEEDPLMQSIVSQMSRERKSSQALPRRI